ncbi:hypothetical protein [Sphaerimonospora thailandensis]|nr:hypothetical protein [Sphaerimonospora thailandensis]
MGSVMRGAAAGAVLLAAVGCTAQADAGASGSQSGTAQPTPTESVRSSRQDIRVTVDPKRIDGGSTKSNDITATVLITAACPLPRGGPEYRATARSDAFTGLVTLVPPARRPGKTGTATFSPTPAAIVPEVRGSAVIRPNAKPGGYRVQVRCEATNDIGDARFRIVEPKPEPESTPTKTKKYPTSAPHAGGGGTAAGGPADDSALPIGLTIAVLLAAAGVGVVVVRRRSATHRPAPRRRSGD